MKTIIVFVAFCCVALLPSNIHGNNDEAQYQAFLDYLNQNAQLGENGELINGMFRLSPNGFLGRGGFGLTYKATFEGRMINNGREVALKFTPLNKRFDAAREYQIYTYLWAIDSPIVESIGIPSVYYFGQCGNYVLMAMTLMDPSFNQRARHHTITLGDILITFREFVRITKYIHSCGVRHDDIKVDNMMYKGNRAFIIDFNLGHKLLKPSTAGTVPFMPRNAHSGLVRFAKDDWESFLYSMCGALHVHLPWFGIDDPNQIYALKLNTTGTLEAIGQMQNARLRTTFLKFATYVLDDDNNNATGFPAYDIFYRFFNKQIEKYQIPQPALVSWLTPEEQVAAVQNNSVVQISQIDEPAYIDEDRYPKVNLYHFRTKYRDLCNFGNIFKRKRSS